MEDSKFALKIPYNLQNAHQACTSAVSSTVTLAISHSPRQQLPLKHLLRLSTIRRCDTVVPYDNSVMESFFASMKREALHRTKYRSEQELRAAVVEYIKFYNEIRPHAKNGYKTPAMKEQEYYANSKQNEEK